MHFVYFICVAVFSLSLLLPLLLLLLWLLIAFSIDAVNEIWLSTLTKCSKSQQKQRDPDMHTHILISITIVNHNAFQNFTFKRLFRLYGQNRITALTMLTSKSHSSFSHTNFRCCFIITFCRKCENPFHLK